MKAVYLGQLLLLSTLSLSGLALAQAAEASAKPVTAPSATSLPASSPVPTASPAGNLDATASPAPSASPAPTASPKPTATATASPTSPVPSASPQSVDTPKPNESSDAAPGQPTIYSSESGPGYKPTQILELSLDDKGGRELSLTEAVRLGIQGASDVLKSENEQSYSGSRLLQAYGQFLPSLGATSSYGYNTGKLYSVVATPALSDGAGKNATYSITADLNLFNGLADFSNLKSSILKKDASDLTVERTKETIALDVSQAFLQVVLDTKLIDIAKKNLQASREREKLLEAQTEVGVKNLSDLFRQQAQTSLDESTLLSSENKNRTDQILLLRKIRLDVNKPYHFIDPVMTGERIESKPAPEQNLLDEALKNRVDLKSSNETADASHWDVHVAASNYFPKIDLVGNMYSGAHTLDRQTVNGADVVPATQPSLGYQFGHQIEYTIGLNLTWTIFDRLITNQNVSRAQANAGDADIDAENRRLQVQGEVRQAYGDFLTSVQQLHSSKKGSDAAQKAYEVMEGRYSVGAASFLDLVTSQSILVQAQSQRAQALINYELQSRALNVAVGKKNIN